MAFDDPTEVCLYKQFLKHANKERMHFFAYRKSQIPIPFPE
jgi:hypothetical protein